MVSCRFSSIAAVTLLVAALIEPAYAQKIYFTDGTPNKIRRANADGSNVKDVVDTSPYDPYSIALDPPRGRIYWTIGGDRIYRATLDGSEPRQFFSTGTPWGVAIDMVHRHIYCVWDEVIRVGIRRANLDGSDVQTIYEDSSNSAPENVAVDVYKEKVYWTQDPGVRRANLDGTDVETVVVSGAWGVAVDPIRERLYWTAPHRELSGKIRRSTLDGQQIEDIGTLAPNAWAEIAVDPYGAKIYWTDRYVIRRANLDGSDVEDVIATTSEYAGPIAIDIVPLIPAASNWALVALLLGLLLTAAAILRRRCVVPIRPHSPFLVAT